MQEKWNQLLRSQTTNLNFGHLSLVSSYFWNMSFADVAIDEVFAEKFHKEMMAIESWRPRLK